MQQNQRLDQRLHVLREEVRTMTQEKQQWERVWREKLQRCQRQLKAKEEEMSRQSQYFQSFKVQLQQKLSVAQDREQTLQSRIYTLEKQLLEMTVNAVTGMATVRAVRITAATVTHLEEQDRLPSTRGEGEGEEEKREERRLQWRSNVVSEREERQEEDVGGENNDAKPPSNEARLQSFIVSLQEDLKVLLEREEGRMTEQRGLMEQLQRAQDNSHFLGCRVEELKAEVQQLKLSESSWAEEVQELKQENHRLQQIFREAVNQTPSLPSSVNESSSSATSSLCIKPKHPPIDPTAMETSLIGSPGEPSSEEGTVADAHHQAAAENTPRPKEHPSPTLKSKPPPGKDPLKHFSCFGSDSDFNFNSASSTRRVQPLEEFKLGNWRSGGIFDVEESPSEESDALREAYRSLGFGEDVEKLQLQRTHLEAALQRSQEESQEMSRENLQLKSQLRKLEEQYSMSESRSGEKICRCSTDGDLLSSSTKDDGTQDLIQALNRENQALAGRIQELFVHIKLREEETTTEQIKLKERISRLEDNVVQLEQENQEQAGLNSQLTRKTEDDLNTIMELQQKLLESEEQRLKSEEKRADCTDALWLRSSKSVTSEDEEATSHSHQNNPSDSLRSSSQKSLHSGELADEAVRLTSSIHNLQTEQQTLADDLKSLKEQRRDVTLSVQQQTEEKKKLTREIWGLKEEKDCVCQSLAPLKQEKEGLNRAVCGLKDKKEQFERSTRGLEEEREQLEQSLLLLQADKETLVQSLSRGRAETDLITQSLQSLQAESDELSQAVIRLREERDKLTASLPHLDEQRHRQQLSEALHENPAEEIKSVAPLKEEEEEDCFQRNREQIMLLIRGPREGKNSPQAEDGQTPTDTRSQRQSPLTDSQAGNDDAKPSQTDHRGRLVQEESDLMKEMEALGVKLKKSQEELMKSRVEIKRLCSELCQSDVRREEVERRAGERAENLSRLSDVNSQMEEIKENNEHLTTQVKQLQNKLTDLLREKSDILSLKSQTEEQLDLLTAQLKAKTIALEELNSEYLVLKRGRSGRDDLDGALVSLRSNYNDIRAKYDALLQRKSQTDLDMAPLKAKLSCLVMKCQQRNNLLAHVMKIIHSRGSVDSNLTQQVEALLNDAALLDYAAAFTPVGVTERPDHWTVLKPELMSIFQGFNRGVAPGSGFLHEPSAARRRRKNGVTPEAETEHCESETHSADEVTTKSPANLQVSFHRVPPAGKIDDPPAGVEVSSPAVSVKESLMAAREAGVPQVDLTEKSPRRPTVPTGSSPRGDSPSWDSDPSRRRSSPEKILHLQEQLQKTLLSSSLDETCRREQPSRRRPPLPHSDHLSASSRAATHNQSFHVQQEDFLPQSVNSTENQRPAGAARPAAARKSATLFKAVLSRSAGATSSPGRFVKFQREGRTSRTSLDVSSSSRLNASQTRVTASPGAPGARRPASPGQSRTTTAGGGQNTTAEESASDVTAPVTTSKTSGAARPGSSSTEKITNCPREKKNRDKPTPDAPAAVGFVEVIKTVGQSSLLIGWERPPLDELFCSNGTFVYGYRVFVDGEFHKSVMSSACTKCVLENVDLSVPLHISVQTLGSNGLASDGVHAVYRTSA